MSYQFRMVLDDEHEHDAEHKAAKGPGKSKSSKTKDDRPEIVRKIDQWERRLYGRLMKRSPAMAYTMAGFQVTPGVPTNRHAAQLKFQLIDAKDTLEYFEGLIRMMQDPTGEEAQKRMARRVATRRLLTVYYDKIEYHDGFTVVWMEDAKEQVVLLRRRIVTLERQIEEARKNLCDQEAEESAAAYLAFVQATEALSLGAHK